jgi:predicted dehydrogenase
LREVVVLGADAMFADPAAPRHWRQVSEYSGLNMLALGILHETLIRWLPDPQRVYAQTQTFTPQRRDPDSGQLRDVGPPDSGHVLTQIPGGALGIYHLSGAIHFGPGTQIHLYGSQGTLKYLLAPEDRLLGGRAGETELGEIDVPADLRGGWRVEADFIDAIRGQGAIEFTDFATGVRYMEFTEAVARSAQTGTAVALPLSSDGT